jgi:tetratricopeptide (TPR) repeat protein
MKMLYAFVLVMASATGEAADISSGSGVVTGTQGEILTNAHVVEACTEINVHFPSGDSGKAMLIARDERNDLAVVRTGKMALSVALFRDGAPVRAGDAVVALGYSLTGLLASTANLSVGNVSALAGLGDDSRYLQISAPVQPGNSGGPLLDASGRLAGIVTAKLNAARIAKFTGDIPQNVNFALKAEVARTFLDSKGIAYLKAPSDQHLSPADVGDIARPFTVHIECRQSAARIAAAPTKSSSPPPSNVYDYFIRGAAYHAKGDLDHAITDYSAAIRLNPKFTTALINHGVAYASKGHFDSAIADYSEAIRLDPRSAIAHNNRGSAYQAKGDFDRAIIDLTEAIRLDPKYARAYFNRDRAYRAKGDLDRAIADSTEAIRLKPKNRQLPQDLVPQSLDVIGGAFGLR